MRKTIPLLIVILFFSCTKSPESYIEHINGYWEIENVTLSNGMTKDYTISETVDFITINDSLKGFRKKMKPHFNGTYETSKDAENLAVKIENDSLNIYYKTLYSTWKETVLLANETQLKVVNDNNDIYTYKRFKPIEIK